jgi:hypothetical protein
MIEMADQASRERAQRLRQIRRERGDREMNVWIPHDVGIAIDEAVASGRYPSRQVAIAHVLKAAFVQKEPNAVT